MSKENYNLPTRLPTCQIKSNACHCMHKTTIPQANNRPAYNICMGSINGKHEGRNIDDGITTFEIAPYSTADVLKCPYRVVLKVTDEIM